MESREARNTMALLALVFITLAACLLQGEEEDLDAHTHMVA